ncbi:MAG TPA: hypothetical protein VGF86_09385 [Candidatus Tumulicola sp.]|jgi:hypothetical protein
MRNECPETMSSSQVPQPTAAERTTAAINVLRQIASASEAQVPQITESSTGVVINRAREAVKKAVGF